MDNNRIFIKYNSFIDKKVKYTLCNIVEKNIYNMCEEIIRF